MALHARRETGCDGAGGAGGVGDRRREGWAGQQFQILRSWSGRKGALGPIEVRVLAVGMWKEGWAEDRRTARDVSGRFQGRRRSSSPRESLALWAAITGRHLALGGPNRWRLTATARVFPSVLLCVCPPARSRPPPPAASLFGGKRDLTLRRRHGLPACYPAAPPVAASPNFQYFPTLLPFLRLSPPPPHDILYSPQQKSPLPEPLRTSIRPAHSQCHRVAHARISPIIPRRIDGPRAPALPPPFRLTRKKLSK